jgi:OOP family OmpA-OmpF porin
MVTRRMLLVMGIITFLFAWVPVKNVYCLQPVIQKDITVTVFKETDIVPVANNVIVLFDSSSSMADPYKDTGMKKIQAEKKLLRDRVEKMPDIKLNIGLYTFSKKLETVYEMQPANKEKLLAAIDTLPDKAGGPTMLQNTLRDIEPILQGVSGRTVVFLFSDGMYTSFEGTNQPSPVEIAKKLANKFDVSFYIISSATAEKEKKMLEAVSSINESSRVVPFSRLMDHPEFYTGAVFIFEEKYISLAETREKVIGFKLGDVLFDFDSANLRLDHLGSLDELGELLVKNPGSTLVLAGFTDSIGSEEYNLGLSRRRVETVGYQIAKKFNIDKERIILLWYGEAAPIAGNYTEAERQKNRRVVGYVDVGS